MKILGKVALVGAPSTGKSTVFNRLIQQRKSIVSEEYGITRDRLYSKCEWLGREFILIDTGGLQLKDAPFQKEIKAQVDLALDEADIIVFLVDAKTGYTLNDEYVARELYKITDKPVILVANKVDNMEMSANIYDFLSLGFGEPIAVSAAHGIGIGDLLDKIVSLLPNKDYEDIEGKITFTLIGRPNVGKSSLVNAILDEQRVIVSNIAGTTRDSIDTAFNYNDKSYVCIDTAGLKRKGKIYEAVDKYAALRAVDAVMRAQVVALVIAADEGITEQDRHVVEIAMENNKPVVIAVNKWDLHSKENKAQYKFTLELKSYYKFLDYAPIVFLSAKNRTNIPELFNAIDKCYLDYNKRVQTSILNQVILDAQLSNQAPDFNGGRIKINYISQFETCPPSFALFVNNPKFMHFSYERYLENVLRKTCGLETTPIKLVMRKKDKKEGGLK
ncbi:MAG: ribosome biogenesis GTPase Der [Firmicutes bacterium]|uniref:GTPase Der n=1 Tax=Candidatus Scatoplasma merdavium TaxID=2840932 RepID=A0A9D9D9R2_9BACL|nr:ribosome biogenesis GTPase Der [Candidatus Scatoplasma merdavium]